MNYSHLTDKHKEYMLPSQIDFMERELELQDKFKDLLNRIQDKALEASNSPSLTDPIYNKKYIPGTTPVAVQKWAKEGMLNIKRGRENILRSFSINTEDLNLKPGFVNSITHASEYESTDGYKLLNNMPTMGGSFYKGSSQDFKEMEFIREYKVNYIDNDKSDTTLEEAVNNFNSIVNDIFSKEFTLSIKNAELLEFIIQELPFLLIKECDDLQQKFISWKSLYHKKYNNNVEEGFKLIELTKKKTDELALVLQFDRVLNKLINITTNQGYIISNNVSSDFFSTQEGLDVIKEILKEAIIEKNHYILTYQYGYNGDFYTGTYQQVVQTDEYVDMLFPYQSMLKLGMIDNTDTALEEFNNLRNSLGMDDLVSQFNLNISCMNHAIYLDKYNTMGDYEDVTKIGSTGVNYLSRAKLVDYPGSWVQGYSFEKEFETILDELVHNYTNRIKLLDPKGVYAGFGTFNDKASVVIGHPTKDYSEPDNMYTGPGAIIYPVEKTEKGGDQVPITTNLTTLKEVSGGYMIKDKDWNGEEWVDVCTPHTFDYFKYGNYGYPITINMTSFAGTDQIDSIQFNKTIITSTVNQWGQTIQTKTYINIPHLFFDKSSDDTWNHNEGVLYPGQFVVIPTVPLEVGTEYTVTIEYGGGKSYKRKFITKDYENFQIIEDVETINIKGGVINHLWLDPTKGTPEQLSKEWHRNMVTGGSLHNVKGGDSSNVKVVQDKVNKGLLIVNTNLNIGDSFEYNFIIPKYIDEHTNCISIASRNRNIKFIVSSIEIPDTYDIILRMKYYDNKKVIIDIETKDPNHLVFDTTIDILMDGNKIDNITIPKGTNTLINHPITLPDNDIHYLSLDANNEGLIAPLNLVIHDSTNTLIPESTLEVQLPDGMDYLEDSEKFSTIICNPIAGNGYLDTTEAAGDVTIDGLINGGIGEVGDDIIITTNYKTFTTQITPNKTWSIIIPGSDLANDSDSTIEIKLESYDENGIEYFSNESFSYQVGIVKSAYNIFIDESSIAPIYDPIQDETTITYNLKIDGNLQMMPDIDSLKFEYIVNGVHHIETAWANLPTPDSNDYIKINSFTFSGNWSSTGDISDCIDFDMNVKELKYNDTSTEILFDNKVISIKDGYVQTTKPINYKDNVLVEEDNQLITLQGLDENTQWWYSLNSGTTWVGPFQDDTSTFNLPNELFISGQIQVKTKELVNGNEAISIIEDELDYEIPVPDPIELTISSDFIYNEDITSLIVKVTSNVPLPQIMQSTVIINNTNAVGFSIIGGEMESNDIIVSINPEEHYDITFGSFGTYQDDNFVVIYENPLSFDTPAVLVDPIVPSTSEYTIMFYVSGDNDFVAKEALIKLREIEQLPIPIDYNIKVTFFIDRAPLNTDDNIDDDGHWSEARRGIIEFGQNYTNINENDLMSTMQSLGEQDSTTYMLEFLNWSKQVCPANKYMLVHLSHGLGLEMDPDYNLPDSNLANFISMREFEETIINCDIEEFELYYNIHCLMGNMNLVDSIATKAKRVIASTETSWAWFQESGHGLTEVIKLLQSDINAPLQSLTDKFLSTYELQNESGTLHYTKTCIDTTSWNSFKSKLGILFQKIGQLSTSDKIILAEAVQSGVYKQRTSSDDSIDIGSFIDCIVDLNIESLDLASAEVQSLLPSIINNYKYSYNDNWTQYNYAPHGLMLFRNHISNNIDNYQMHFENSILYYSNLIDFVSTEPDDSTMDNLSPFLNEINYVVFDDTLNYSNKIIAAPVPTEISNPLCNVYTSNHLDENGKINYVLKFNYFDWMSFDTNVGEIKYRVNNGIIETFIPTSEIGIDGNSSTGINITFPVPPESTIECWLERNDSYVISNKATFNTLSYQNILDQVIITIDKSTYVRVNDGEMKVDILAYNHPNNESTFNVLNSTIKLNDQSTNKTINVGTDISNKSINTITLYDIDNLSNGDHTIMIDPCSTDSNLNKVRLIEDTGIGITLEEYTNLQIDIDTSNIILSSNNTNMDIPLVFNEIIPNDLTLTFKINYGSEYDIIPITIPQGSLTYNINYNCSDNTEYIFELFSSSISDDYEDDNLVSLNLGTNKTYFVPEWIVYQTYEVQAITNNIIYNSNYTQATIIVQSNNILNIDSNISITLNNEPYGNCIIPANSLSTEFNIVVQEGEMYEVNLSMTNADELPIEYNETNYIPGSFTVPIMQELDIVIDNNIIYSEDALSASIPVNISASFDFDLPIYIKVDGLTIGTGSIEAGLSTTLINISITPETEYNFIADTDGTLLPDNFSGYNLGNIIVTTPAASITQETWNIMVYINSDNNLEEFGLIDLNEMESVQLPDNVTMTFQIDRIAGYDTSEGDWTTARRGKIIKDTDLNDLTSADLSQSNYVEDIGEINMGDANELKNFINWSASSYPADNYAIISWNHGISVWGSSTDDTSSEAGEDFWMSIPELKNALDTCSVDKFELLGFDMCVMQCIDNVYAFKDNANVIVASQDNEPGDGWDYAGIINLMNSTITSKGFFNTEDLANSIIESFATFYETYQGTTTLSAIDTTSSKVDTFISKMNTLLQDISTSDAVVKTDIKNFPYFDLIGYEIMGGLGEELYDIRAYLTYIMNNISSLAPQANNARIALDNMTIINASTADERNGLSLYLPYDESSMYWNYKTDPLYTETNFSVIVDLSLS